jgi:uncharacterized small protein (DUF1192 family)
MEDDLLPRPKASGPPEDWSIEELALRIGELRVEIGKYEALIARKRQDRDAAEALFGKR